jgi:RIO kinase 3
MSSQVASPWGRPAATAGNLTGNSKPSFSDVMRRQEDDRAWEASEKLAYELQNEDVVVENVAVAVSDEELARALDAQLNGTDAKAETSDNNTDDGTSDFALALALQRQFNDEHDSYINEAETRLNSQGGRVTVSLDRFRSAYPEDNSNVALHARPVDADDGESDDEIFEEFGDEPLQFDRGTKTMRNACGEIVTKHNADRASNQNKNRMTDNLPLSFPCGDMHKGKGGAKKGGGKQGRVPNHVYNKLQAHANKAEKHRMRVTEKKDTSTSDMAIDSKTRLILFRLINASVIDQVNGAISSGKEAAVFHANRRPDPESNGGDATEVAIKVFKTTLTEFKQRQQFLHGDRRFEDRVGRQSARKLVKLWAEKESANLTRMAHAGVPCPPVILLNKHVLLLGFIGNDGVAAPKIKDVRLGTKARADALKQTREAMNTMYKECKLVHADLSEYNMLYHDKKVYIIDVGQAVDTSHPRAMEFLYRDCVNVCHYFSKIGEESTPTPQTLFFELTGVKISDDQVSQYKERINASRRAPKSKLANTEAYMLGLCDLSTQADPGPAFYDPFVSATAAAVAAGDGSCGDGTAISSSSSSDDDDDNEEEEGEEGKVMMAAGLDAVARDGVVDGAGSESRDALGSPRDGSESNNDGASGGGALHIDDPVVAQE